MNEKDLTTVVRAGCSEVHPSLNHLYYNHNVNSVGQHSKLRTYVEFKSDFEMDNYLDVEEVPSKWRKLFCCLRVSCHDLEIERGRYSL